MPLKLNVGLSRKLGQANYGSLGASCHVEVELDGALLQNDLDSFHRHVRNAFLACRQAVHDELSRCQDRPSGTPTGEQPAANRTNTNGHQGHGRRASQNQLDYANKLAGQIKELGIGSLESLAGKICGKPIADLSSSDVSGLINILKDIKAGKIILEDALSGAASTD
jgi:hypothetical protein